MKSLSARQCEVMRLVAVGYSDKEISSQVGISVRTVNAHIVAARKKCKARNRAHAAVIFVSMVKSRTR